MNTIFFIFPALKLTFHRHSGTPTEYAIHMAGSRSATLSARGGDGG
jgi:hypothetical protein